MRILMLAPTPFFSDRGCHVRIFEEVKALQTIDHEVIVCTYGHGRDLPGIRTARAPAVPWYQKFEPGPSLHKLYVDPLLLARAVATGMRFKPHVIHAHLHEGAVLGILLKRLFKVPLVLDYQGSFTEELAENGTLERGTLLYRLSLAAEGRLYKYVNAILCNTQYSAMALRSTLRDAGDRVQVISDGADSQFYRRVDAKQLAKLREELCLPRDSKLVVYAGTLNRVQGIEVLLSAAKVLLSSREDVSFLLMGYPNVQVYEAQAQRMGLSGRVKFTGSIPYHLTPAYLSLGDVAVSPKLSTTEGNSKLFAYMGIGLPTVCSDLPVNQEILGDLGVYAKTGDAQSLAAGLAQILDSAAARQKLGPALRERLEREFSYATIGQRLSDVYKSVTERARPDAV